MNELCVEDHDGCPVFGTVKLANQALDLYMGRKGYSSKGGHCNRPDGTRGPVVAYPMGACELVFVVDREKGRWKVSTVWLMRNRKPVSLADLLNGFDEKFAGGNGVPLYMQWALIEQVS